MIKRDRDIGGGEEEKKIVCHFLFDLTVENSSAYNLQVESADLIPKGAKNIRPVFEGAVVQETYDLLDPQHPKPVRKIHTHELGEGRMSSVGGYQYRWTTTRDESLSPIEAIVFKIKHPIYRD